MRKLALISLLLTSAYGTLAVASDAVSLSSIIHHFADTADTAGPGGDTASGNDTADTATPIDDTSTPTDDTGGGSADTGDTGDTGSTDTGRDGYSAAELAGELGGFGCSSTPIPSALGAGAWLGSLALALVLVRRRQRA